MPSPFDPPSPPNPHAPPPEYAPPQAGPFGAPNPYGQPPSNPYGQPPPSNPFGAPPTNNPFANNAFGAQPNPYAPPSFPDAGAFDSEPVKEGSYGLGLAVGLIFALIGLLIVYFTGKEETKKGALHGFLVRMGISVLIFLLI